VKAPEGTPVQNVIIRLAPTGRYTTPDSAGNFHFYNLSSGDYEVVLERESLPQHSIVVSPSRVPVTVRSLESNKPVEFRFEITPPEKTVRKLFERK
jgi:hypothetical protein